MHTGRAKMAMSRKRRTSPLATSVALEFAKLTTVVDNDIDSFVHRIGKHSVFGVFSTCCAGFLLKHRQGSKLAITTAQLNKHRELDEFCKIRNRFIEIDGEDEIGSYSFWRRREGPERPSRAQTAHRRMEISVHAVCAARRRECFLDAGLFLNSVKAACIDTARRREVQREL
mmetsp:Transcript_27738/g.55801  ORF Transcript_27738/g.55801 Transcript_27738/m.55801 type:complete len:172 (-) Transcript_27738:334-849(-)